MQNQLGDNLCPSEVYPEVYQEVMKASMERSAFTLDQDMLDELSNTVIEKLQMLGTETSLTFFHNVGQINEALAYGNARQQFVFTNSQTQDHGRHFYFNKNFSKIKVGNNNVIGEGKNNFV
jgi:hypothetical protein